jgi:hypothetical protein
MRFRMTGKTDGNIWVEGLSGGYDSAILANPGVSYQVVARLLASPGHMAAPRFQPALVSKMGCCAVANDLDLEFKQKANFGLLVDPRRRKI